MKNWLARDAEGRVIDVSSSDVGGDGGDAGPHNHTGTYAPVVHAHDGGGEHPDLATHTGLGLAADDHTHQEAAHDHTGVYATDVHSHALYATDTDLSDHAATTHGTTAHAIDGALHTGTTVLPSVGQKNALAGTSGTPGDLNRYVTNSDSRLSDARTPSAHTHLDADLPSGLARDAEVTSAIATHAATPHGGAAAEAFPVGSVFLSVVSTNPGTLLGYGTWSAFGQGRMLLGWNTGDTDEATGGAATHTHAAHTGVINHTHPVTDPGHTHVENSNNATTGALRGWGAPDTSTGTSQATGFSTASSTTGVTTENPAGGVASLTHDSPNHLPPYVIVRMWKRTA